MHTTHTSTLRRRSSVSKRGNLKVEYPSSAQAKKLWNILEKRFQVSFSFFHVNWHK